MLKHVIEKYIGSPAKLHALLLFIFSIFIIFSRIPGIDEPLERDITGYAVIGHEILHGKLLYTDIWDHKPPGIYLAYALTDFIFGYNQFSIVLMGIILTIFTLIGIYLCVIKYNNNILYASGAAFVWLFMSSDIKLEANQPNVEAFLNLFIVWIIYIALTVKTKPLQNSEYIAIGILLFIASTFKTIEIFVAIPLWIALIFIEYRFYGTNFTTIFKKSISMASTGIVGWLIIFCYFLIEGKFNDFFGAVFIFNKFYAGSLLVNFLEGLKPQLFFAKYVIQYIPLYLLMITGPFISFYKHKDIPSAYLIISCIIGVYFSFSAPGFFFSHYYQLWAPILIIGSIMGMHNLLICIPKQFIKIYYVLIIAIPTYFLILSIAIFRLTPTEWSANKYGITFIEAKQVADKINELLIDNESIYEWGTETGLYFYTDKRPITKIIFVSHFVLNNEFSKTLMAETFDNLKANPPDLFVVNTGYLQYNNEHKALLLGGTPILEWFKKNYDIYSDLFKEPHYIGGALKGSNLSHRLSLKHIKQDIH